MAWKRHRDLYLTPVNDETTWWKRWRVAQPRALDIGKPQIYYAAKGELRVPVWLKPINEIIDGGNSIDLGIWSALTPHWVNDGWECIQTHISQSRSFDERGFWSTCRAETQDPGRTPTDRGPVLKPTYPEPSWARWCCQSPYVIRSGGGKSREDPFQFRDAFRIQLDVKEHGVPRDGATIFSLGETLKIYHKSDGEIYVRARLIDTAAVDDTVTNYHQYHEFKIGDWIGGNTPRRYAVAFGPVTAGLDVWRFYYNTAVGLALNWEHDASLWPATTRLYHPSWISQDDRKISEPLNLLNDWHGETPWVDAVGDRSGTLLALYLGTAWNGFFAPPGPEFTYEYHFTKSGTRTYPDINKKALDAISTNVQWSMGGVSLVDADEFGGIYIPPHIPQHNYKMVFLADTGNGEQSILRAYSVNGEDWFWSPRERPLVLVRDYRANRLDGETDYYNGHDGSAGTQPSSDNVGLLQTLNGRRYLFVDLRRSTASDYSGIFTADLWDDEVSWQTLFGVLSPAYPGGMGILNIQPALNPRGAGQSDWDAESVRFGSVQYVPSLGIYKLWYSGRNATSDEQIGWTAAGLAANFTLIDGIRNRCADPIIESDQTSYDELGVFGASGEIGGRGGDSSRYLYFTAIDDTVPRVYYIQAAVNDEPDNIYDTDPYEPVEEEWDTSTDDPPNGAANRILGLHRHYRLNEQEVMVASYDRLYVGSDDSAITDYLAGTFAEVWDWNSNGNRIYFESSGDQCYVSQGVDQNVWWNGAVACIQSPACTEVSDSTVKGPGAGALANNQNYYWRYSWVRSADAFVSPPSPIDGQATGAGDDAMRVALTQAGFNQSSNLRTGVDGMYIYAAIDPAGPFYRCTHAGLQSPLVPIANTTTGAIIRHYATDASTPEPTSYVNTPIARIIRYYHGVPFYGRVATYPGRVYYGTSASSQLVSSTAFFDFDAEGGGKIVNLLRCQDYLLVLCEQAIFAIYGHANTGFFWRRVTNQLGAVSPGACINVGGPVAFLAHKGMYITNGTSNDLKLISRKVAPRLKEIPKAYIDECVAGYDTGHLYLWFPHYSNINKRCLHYNFFNDTWDERTGDYGYVNAFTRCDGAVDKGEMLVGDSRYGYVHNLNAGVADNDRPIKLRWETGDLVLSSKPEWDIRARKLHLDMRGDAGLGNMTVMSDRAWREWIGTFNLPLLNIVMVGLSNPFVGGIISFPLAIGKTQRESSLSQYIVGRSHRVVFEAESDRGNFTFNGFTLMHRAVRRK